MGDKSIPLESLHMSTFKCQAFKCHGAVSLLSPFFPFTLYTSFIIFFRAILHVSASLSWPDCLCRRVALCISSFVSGFVSDAIAILSAPRHCLYTCLPPTPLPPSCFSPIDPRPLFLPPLSLSLKH